LNLVNPVFFQLIASFISPLNIVTAYKIMLVRLVDMNVFIRFFNYVNVSLLFVN